MRSLLYQIITINHAAFHHEADTLEQRDVLQRIAGNSDEIGVFALISENRATDVQM
jgi:hypothetical protein